MSSAGRPPQAGHVQRGIADIGSDIETCDARLHKAFQGGVNRGAIRTTCENLAIDEKKGQRFTRNPSEIVSHFGSGRLNPARARMP